jgi:hypothetical protein
MQILSSHLPWLGWLACSFVAFVIALLAFVLPNNLQPRGGYVALFMLLTSALAAVVLLVVASIRFFN